MSERKKLKMVSSMTAREEAHAGQAGASSPALAMPEPEVRALPKRRQFSAAYKLSVLEEADRANDFGAIGALLRREGLYSSHLSTWRREREAGALAALGRTRGRKIDSHIKRLRKKFKVVDTNFAQIETLYGIGYRYRDG